MDTIRSIPNISSLLPHGPRARGSDFRETLRESLAALQDPAPMPGAGSTGQGDPKPVRLGTISQDNPTVSHLLIHHPRYGEECWEIIHQPVNGQKAFRTLQPGEAIYLNPKTREIYWGNENAPDGIEPGRNSRPDAEPRVSLPTGSAGPPSAADPGDPKPDAQSRRDPFEPGMLPRVLENYMGTPYGKLDCYELLVRGFQDLGVDYAGRNGLKSVLMDKAIALNLPINAYLTGEGLIEASSQPVYSETFKGAGHSDATAEKVWRDLENRLEPGQILSFSTRRGGHTGVISKTGDTWTFLNSGVLNNAVRAPSGRKGVGEEDLKAEIQGWFRRAGREHSHLRITIGKPDRDKLVSFLKTSPLRTAL